MDDSIKVIVHRGSAVFDSIIVTPHSVEYEVEEKKVPNKIDANTDKIEENNSTKINRVSLNKKGCNAYLVSVYATALTKSQMYCRSAHKRLLEYLTYKGLNNTNLKIILIKLRTPRKQFLDHKWNEKVTQMALERREVDRAMSWLSTLGGAFSALGDKFQYCAEIAGKISVKQFELALRLGDPLLVARCKLYAALSLIQQGHLEVPRKIVRSIYKFSINQNDTRLQNMCLGIWAKLQYCYTERKKLNKSC